MTVLAILPARYGSTRFPGKPLTPIAGKPMIQHVWERTRLAKRVDAVAVATDDPRIRDACLAFGAQVEMTSPDHPTGTDRLAEVAARYDHDVIVNVQGDEPLIEGFVIDAAIDALLTSDLRSEARPNENRVGPLLGPTSMSTVVHRAEPDAFDDPNRVKVVVDRNGYALYFSRASIPFRRKDTGLAPLQHVGLYVYRKDFLLEFVKWTRTPAEQAEELEQLRALENGHRIRVAEVEGWTSVPVDVPADVARVERALQSHGNRPAGATHGGSHARSRAQ
jgi:3-deoxy-manno-octulosonate cytidylyltransferase (CMP-KDO synthetase)